MYDFKKERQVLCKYWEQKTEDELHAFKEQHNTQSIDGKSTRHLVLELPIRYQKKN